MFIYTGKNNIECCLILTLKYKQKMNLGYKYTYLVFAPHDARRTLLTDILNNGGSVADAQFIAGHSNPQTTLRYAKVSDAKEVKGRIKTSYWLCEKFP